MIPRNHPAPGVMIPIAVNRPMMPKTNAPMRIRSMIGMSGMRYENLMRSALFVLRCFRQQASRPSPAG